MGKQSAHGKLGGKKNRLGWRVPFPGLNERNPGEGNREGKDTKGGEEE